MKFRNFSLLLALSIIININLIAQTHDLTYKFEKGKTYYYKMLNDIVMKQNVNGQGISTGMNSKVIYKYEITDVTSNEFGIIISVDSMVAKSDSPFISDEQLNESSKNIIGKKFKEVLDKSGKLIFKYEIDKMASGMNMSIQGTSNILLRLSNKPVAIGESWQNIDTIKTSMEGQAEMLTIITTDLTLTGSEIYNNIECMKINIKQNATITGGNGAQGNGIDMDGTMQGSGYILFDEKLGLTKNLNQEMESNINMIISGQNIPMTMEQKMKMTITLME